MSAGPEWPALLPRRIILTGFMGAGKSTVGRMLAARLGWRFFDTDAVITAQQQMTVAQIFATHGEARFRQLESEAFDQAWQPEQTVIALGGGAMEAEMVRARLFAASAASSDSITIFLEAPLVALLERCHSAAHHPVRPLLTSAETPEDRLARRLPHYRLAHLTIATEELTPEGVVDRILAQMKRSDQSSTNGYPR